MNTPLPIIKGIAIWLVCVFVLAAVFIFTANLFSYFDPATFCYIGIDNDWAQGNQKTIQKAIRQLKAQDKVAYRTLCSSVDAIIEDYCMVIDASGGGVSQPDASGCYVKGSKIIYVRPTKDESLAMVSQRAATIKKYAEYSKNFWTAR